MPLDVDTWPVHELPGEGGQRPHPAPNRADKESRAIRRRPHGVRVVPAHRCDGCFNNHGFARTRQIASPLGRHPHPPLGIAPTIGCSHAR